MIAALFAGGWSPILHAIGCVGFIVCVTWLAIDLLAGPRARFDALRLSGEFDHGDAR